MRIKKPTQLISPPKIENDHYKKQPWITLGTILLGILINILTIILVEYIIEPAKSDILSYYYILDNVPVTLARNPEIKGNELNSMFSIVVKSNKLLNINHVRIHSIAKIIGTTLYCSVNDINRGINDKVKMRYNSDEGILTISDIPTIPADSRFIVNILGVLDMDKCNPVIVLENNKFIWPIESFLVTESTLFLARNWQLVLSINIICILSIYYFLKKRLRP
ncbi:MAG: hypothetical protein L7F77_04340 [Candidatus Magnetominusculus sp. LBB02]|nr:hypothetical protein [Candidatus Magnetominusculus sp. LBB02]